MCLDVDSYDKCSGMSGAVRFNSARYIELSSMSTIGVNRRTYSALWGAEHC